jgi:hypothetical protein
MSAHEGWTNYPTWAVNLWLSNDEGLYREARRRAAAEPDPYRLSIDLKDWVTNELAPDLEASFTADLLSYALGGVDWMEIAQHWLADIEAEPEGQS